MLKKTITALVAFILTSCSSTSQSGKENDQQMIGESNAQNEIPLKEPHRYGGWYCPDNLNGFPPVDVKEWKNVPVVNGRMPTLEETQNGTSLIFVDQVKYPNAKPLDMSMPKLAMVYNQQSKREELIIVIQAILVDNDSIVGYRYLNGGNGSSRVNEVRFLSENEMAMIPSSRFVFKNISIDALPQVIWEVMTKPDNAKMFQSILDKENRLTSDWRKASNVNYSYAKSGKITSSYADKLFGNYYIQNDYDRFNYNEKFLLLNDENTNTTTLKIVCGPYGDDFESQKEIIIDWAQKVKTLSEKK